MSDDRPNEPETESTDVDLSNRRRFLQIAAGASAVGLAGCQLLDEPVDDEEPPRPSDWCIEEFDVEVDDVFTTAESIDGIQRDPDDLTTREGAAYQCHPQGYQLCANCRYFIPGKPAETGSGFGACAIVEGVVRSQDWCALYQETERLAEFPDPDPLGTPGIQKPPRRR